MPVLFRVPVAGVLLTALFSALPLPGFANPAQPATVSAAPAVAAPAVVAADPARTPITGPTPTAAMATAPAPTGANVAAPTGANVTAPTIATEPVKPTAPPKPAVTLAIDIDLSRQHLTVKEYGKVVGSWPISSGKDGHRTPTGVFRPSWMAKMWYSRKYDDAPMPHSVFFNDGIALHATQVTHLLGRPASHGCIRQAPANAARTYALVQKHGLSSTRVTVHGVARDTVPAYARSQGDTPRIARAVPTRSTYASSDRAIDSSRTYIPQVRQIVIVDSWGNRRVATVATSYARPVPATRQLYYPATIGRSYASGYR